MGLACLGFVIGLAILLFRGGGGPPADYSAEDLWSDDGIG